MPKTPDPKEDKSVLEKEDQAQVLMTLHQAQVLMTLQEQQQMMKTGRQEGNLTVSLRQRPGEKEKALAIGSQRR